MGLECLSRGAARAVFFERHPPAVALLKKNIDALRVGHKTLVLTGDVFKAGGGGVGGGGDSDSTPMHGLDERADVIFLDPPYRYLNEQPRPLLDLAGKLANSACDQSVLCFRHDEADSLALPPWTLFRELKYGGMVIELMRLPEGR